MKYERILLLGFLLIMQYSIACQAKDLNIVFLNPGHPTENSTGNFWQNVTRFMNAAAHDLSINLVTIYAYRNHVLMQSQIKEIIKHNPDYVVLVNEKGKAPRLVKELSQHKIPVFMLLNTFNNLELSELSEHTQQSIIGSVRPNNLIAGKKLLNGLKNIQGAFNLTDEVKTKFVLALQGDFATAAAIERQQGFNLAIKESEHLLVIDSSVANWDKEQAYQKVKGIIQRQRIDIIWAANDAMAFGAKKAVQEKKLDYRVAIGGFNWDTDDVNYPVDLSLGGHVSLGAYALVMLKDINNDKLPCGSRHQMLDIFEPSNNIHQQAFSHALINNELDNFRFKKFSFSFNYNARLSFTIENIISTLDDKN